MAPPSTSRLCAPKLFSSLKNASRIACFCFCLRQLSWRTFFSQRHSFRCFLCPSFGVDAFRRPFSLGRTLPRVSSAGGAWNIHVPIITIGGFPYSIMASLRNSSSSNNEESNPTVGIIVIGDEILKGRVQDTNSAFLIKRLTRLGLYVTKVSFITDDIASIRKEVKEFSERFTYVITCGGIGPTHDDVTFQGVAEAFDDVLTAHPELVTLISNYFKTDDLSSPPMKMAHVPSAARLVYGEDHHQKRKSQYPVVQVHNVTLLPGIPKLLEGHFPMIEKILFGEHSTLQTAEVFLTVDEVTIAASLNNTVNQFPSVAIGSYPQLSHSYYRTLVVFEAQKPDLVRTAKNHFLQQINSDYTLKNYVSDCSVEPCPRLEALRQRAGPQLQSSIREAFTVLKSCLSQYRPEEICVCFNGGKDCLVVLHLYFCLLHQSLLESDKNSNAAELPDVTAPRVQAVYITEDNPFPQITQFVHQTINRYDLDCKILPGPLKLALHKLLDEKPAIKAVIMGTRITDPYSGNLTFFVPTNMDWPKVMRVMPILNWQYSAVWEFIRGLYLPYCSLYDRGYTSLGNASNTIPNPKLQTLDRFGAPTYKPAYKLQDTEHERCGRL